MMSTAQGPRSAGALKPTGSLKAKAQALSFKKRTAPAPKPGSAQAHANTLGKVLQGGAIHNKTGNQY